MNSSHSPVSKNILKSLTPYQKSSNAIGIWQTLNTFIPYIAVWVAMYFTVQFSWLLTLCLAIIASGLLLRIFVIFHDCGHGSFFRSRVLNDAIGLIGGLFVFTPYHQWRYEHAIHHATSGNLDKRGIGDVWTLTVKEYLAASFIKRFFYRLIRNPFFLFVIAPYFLILGWQRVPSPKTPVWMKISVVLTSIAIAGMAWGLGAIYGGFNYAVIQLFILGCTGSFGVWLFYVQHQFEGAYWQRGKEWDYVRAAIKGSSYYKLPKILQWFSANIGFHHIHHLSPRIPNYRLQDCHQAIPALQEAPTLTFWMSLKAMSFRLWDEQNQKLVGFKALRSVRVRE